MKRIGFVMPEIRSYPNLLLAFRKASKGKRNRPAVREFSDGLSQRLQRMAEAINQNNIVVGDYARFIVRDPKVRVIHAPCFRERVLHHAIINVAGPSLERSAIDQSCACRQRKGNTAAIRFAQKYLRAKPNWLKMDIAKFFDSVDHEILKDRLRRYFKDQPFLNLLDRVIDSYQTAPNCGLPIGALTSQYLANFTLDPLDHFVKEQLKCRHYVRFMDDFVLWDDDQVRLRRWREEIQHWLTERTRLAVKESSRVGRSSEGLLFLGYRLKPDAIYLSKRSRRRFRRRHHRNESDYCDGRLEMSQLQRHTDSLLAFTDHASCSDWRRAVLSLDDREIER